MRKYLSLCIVSIILGLLPSKVFATQDHETYCNPYYKDVDVVFVNYQREIPESYKLNWVKIIRETTDTARKYLEKENVGFEYTAKTAEEVLKEHPQALYLNLMYSYADKDAFTIPMPEDQIISWVEVSRVLNGEIKNYKVEAFNQGISISNYSDSFTQKHVNLAAAQKAPLYFVACGVLRSTTYKGCSDMEYGAELRTSSNKIIPIWEKCIEIPPSLLAQAYEQLLKIPIRLTFD